MAGGGFFLTAEYVKTLPKEFSEPNFVKDVAHDTGVHVVIGGGESFSRPGYVYFARAGSTFYFKVGRTGDPKTRLSNLRTGNPLELRMKLVYVTDMKTAEGELIRTLKTKEGEGITHQRGEWFEATNTTSFNKAQDYFAEIVESHCQKLPKK
jgi:hypothetical protein